MLIVPNGLLGSYQVKPALLQMTGLILHQLLAGNKAIPGPMSRPGPVQGSRDCNGQDAAEPQCFSTTRAWSSLVELLGPD